MEPTTFFSVLNEAIQQEPIPVLGIIFGITGGVILVLGKSIVGAWMRVRVTEAESALKQDMLDKGMSATDIERVINAGGSRSRKD